MLNKSAALAVILLANTPLYVAAQNIVIDGGEPCALDPARKVTIEPDSGNVIVYTQDGSGCGSTSTPVLPTINSFSLNPVSASQDGGTIDIAATYTTTGATSCSGTGDLSFRQASNWDAALLTQSANGDQIFQLSTGALNVGSYTVQLQCANAAGSVTDSVQFGITEGATTTECSGTAPTNLTRDTAIDRLSPSTKTETFASVYGTFGGSSTHDLRIDRNKYAALSFSTTTQTDKSFGGISIFDGTATPEGPYVVSISECPGDFGPGLPEGCRQLLDPLSFADIDWETVPNVTADGTCSLDLNKSYYFNMVPAVELPTTRNPEWACGTNSDGSPNTSAGSCAVKSTATEDELQ